MSSINRDTNDPIRLALRSYIKRKFLINLDILQSDFHEKFKDAELVIFGSTLMRLLSAEQKIIFPYHGRKASDVDIGVYTPKYYKSDEFESKFLSHIPKILFQSVKNSKMDFEVKSENTFLKIENEKSEKFFTSLGILEKLLEEFVISKTFDRVETERILSKDSQSKKLLELFYVSKDESFYADTIISIQKSPPKLLLGTANFLPNRGDMFDRIDLKRDNRLNLLTSKIGRAFLVGFKATDFIDIYNLTNSTPAIFNFDNRQEDNYYNHSRCMILAYMAAEGIRPEYDKRLLLENFNQNKLDEFMNQCDKVISTIQKISTEEAFMFIKNARDLIFKSFGFEGDNSSLNLEDLFSLNEKNFLASQFGYEYLPSGHKRSLEGSFDLNIGLLKLEHKTTFDKYPQLEVNLRNYYQIVERIEDNKEKYNQRIF